MAAHLRLKEVLIKRNVSMSRLSRMTDISYNTIQALCRDTRRNVSLHTLSLIAEALEIPISDLYYEERPGSSASLE